MVEQQRKIGADEHSRRPADERPYSRRLNIDWHDHDESHRRLICEFIGTFGLMFVLSAGAAIFARYAQPKVSNLSFVVILSAVAALWLVAAIYAFGDISAHFNPAITLAFVLLRMMTWSRAVHYWIAQCGAACGAALLARNWFGAQGALAAAIPASGAIWQTIGFEAIVTGGFVLLVLSTTQGPKVNGPFTALSVAAYVMSLAIVGGLYDGAPMNPARALGPDVALGRIDWWWPMACGEILGTLLAVALGVALRSPARFERGR
ncbi:MAG: aquaporin [Candidatus Eremiobacteraeota bacterium]|nr:aquaporin [Candidatus Eremiobacteraeota bacterium]